MVGVGCMLMWYIFEVICNDKVLVGMLDYKGFEVGFELGN